MSGYIRNGGTLADIIFVGAYLEGGYLAGMIRNASQVGGMIADVMLLPGAYVVGGRMMGVVEGDPVYPALLEVVEVLPGSYLRQVVLRQGVQQGEAVWFEELGP